MTSSVSSSAAGSIVATLQGLRAYRANLVALGLVVAALLCMAALVAAFGVWKAAQVFQRTLVARKRQRETRALLQDQMISAFANATMNEVWGTTRRSSLHSLLRSADGEVYLPSMFREQQQSSLVDIDRERVSQAFLKNTQSCSAEAGRTLDQLMASDNDNYPVDQSGLAGACTQAV